MPLRPIRLDADLGSELVRDPPAVPFGALPQDQREATVPGWPPADGQPRQVKWKVVAHHLGSGLIGDGPEDVVHEGGPRHQAKVAAAVVGMVPDIGLENSPISSAEVIGSDEDFAAQGPLGVMDPGTPKETLLGLVSGRLYVRDEYEARRTRPWAGSSWSGPRNVRANSGRQTDRRSLYRPSS